MDYYVDKINKVQFKHARSIRLLLIRLVHKRGKVVDNPILEEYERGGIERQTERERERQTEEKKKVSLPHHPSMYATDNDVATALARHDSYGN